MARSRKTPSNIWRVDSPSFSTPCPEATLQKVDETIFAVHVQIPMIRDTRLRQGPCVKPVHFQNIKIMDLHIDSFHYIFLYCCFSVWFLCVYCFKSNDDTRLVLKSCVFNNKYLDLHFYEIIFSNKVPAISIFRILQKKSSMWLKPKPKKYC